MYDFRWSIFRELIITEQFWFRKNLNVEMQKTRQNFVYARN